MRALAQKMQKALTSRVAVGVDQAFNKVIFGRTEASRRGSTSESLGPTERLAALRAVEATYAPYLAEPERCFPRVMPARFEESFVRPLGPHGVVVDLSWSSPLAPLHLDEELARRLGSRAASNELAHARLFLHRDAPRPAIILLHGYLGGDVRVEERAFPVRWLFDRGLDVVLGVLPHHGKRGVRGKRPLLPASDPRLTIEGFRHGIVDLRTLVAYLRQRGSRA
ncbi:MAG: hypothetical protein ACK5U8_01070, partial [Deltaproteobacteria bacterium]